MTWDHGWCADRGGTSPEAGGTDRSRTRRDAGTGPPTRMALYRQSTVLSLRVVACNGAEPSSETEEDEDADGERVGMGGGEGRSGRGEA
ncbi:hypothetical protein [Natronorarus salvus]|uniref:hypothetical protein n=1 Tax=Natronorarus salvus TaxID=3117733 RepID=UPI002F26AE88